jgi:hypothetical protein
MLGLVLHGENFFLSNNTGQTKSQRYKHECPSGNFTSRFRLVGISKDGVWDQTCLVNANSH